MEELQGAIDDAKQIQRDAKATPTEKRLAALVELLAWHVAQERFAN